VLVLRRSSCYSVGDPLSQLRTNHRVDLVPVLVWGMGGDESIDQLLSGKGSLQDVFRFFMNLISLIRVQDYQDSGTFLDCLLLRFFNFFGFRDELLLLL